MEKGIRVNFVLCIQPR